MLISAYETMSGLIDTDPNESGNVQEDLGKDDNDPMEIGRWIQRRDIRWS